MAKTMKTGVLAAAIVCAAFLSACGGGNSAFAGKWYLVEGEGNYIPEDIELLKDGTGFALEQAIAWKTEGDRFYITHPDMAMAFDYTISGSIIDLANDDGDKFVYAKWGGPAALVGEWEIVSVSDNGEQLPRPEGDAPTITYNSDGTLIRSLVDDDALQFKWAADKDTLYEIVLLHGEVVDMARKSTYKIEGATMTRTWTSIATQGGAIIEKREIIEELKRK